MCHVNSRPVSPVGRTVPETIALLNARTAHPAALRDLQLREKPSGPRLADAGERFELGATYHGEDLTGLWSTRLRVDERGWTLDVTQREGAMLAGAALPMVRLLAAARAGDTLRLGTPVDGHSRFLDVVLADDLQDDDHRVRASAVETLHAVQERTAASFPVPARMTGLDVRNVRDALRLLDGEAVTVGNGDVLTIKGLHPGAGPWSD